MEKKRRETSKILLFAVLFVSYAMAAFVLAGWWHGREDATGVLTVVLAPLPIVIGFYTWKAKAENMAKHGVPPDDAVDAISDQTICGFQSIQENEGGNL